MSSTCVIIGLFRNYIRWMRTDLRLILVFFFSRLKINIEFENFDLKKKTRREIW